MVLNGAYILLFDTTLVSHQDLQRNFTLRESQINNITRAEGTSLYFEKNLSRVPNQISPLKTLEINLDMFKAFAAIFITKGDVFKNFL